MPRSEENHSCNGLVYDEVTNKLFVTVSGNTNAGSPSKLFTYHSEYALSAAILSIDMNMINAMPVKDINSAHPYIYDLPTLDDPTRPNLPDGSDVNDPFGGNDGLNQAKIVPGGPVQVYASGFRNAYDVIITKTPGKQRLMYTIDNGPNGNWGGHPENENTPNVTNNYVEGEPGSTNNGPNDPTVNNLDNLHLIGNIDSYTPGSFYGGHPNPTRANPAGAGLYTHDGPIDGGTRVWRTQKTNTPYPLPTDWPPLPISMANPVEADYRSPGETDGAFITFTSSVNGFCEYTASNFNNALKGNLLAAGFNGVIHRIKLNANGTAVLNNLGNKKLNLDPPIASGFGNKPLDITAQGDTDLFPGTVWIAVYASNTITILEPQEVACTAANNQQDDDGDGYTNADELANNTDPCSAASKPNDNDMDFLSDLLDNDDDNDGINDMQDYFALDFHNGSTTELPLKYELFNNDPGTGFFGVGFTGLMSNGTSDYRNLFDIENIIAGGAAGVVTIENVHHGDAEGSLNNQQYAFQFGLKTTPSMQPFKVTVAMPGTFFNGNQPSNYQSQGFYIGKGDQDTYVKITLGTNGSQPAIRVVYENNGNISSNYYPIAGLPTTSIKLSLLVNPSSGIVQPQYIIDGGFIQNAGNNIQLHGELLNIIKGSASLAIGIIATSRGASPFNASWDYIEVEPYNIPVSENGTWVNIAYQGATQPAQRHECGFVQAGNKFYLMGGRGVKAVNIFNYETNTWETAPAPPIQLHHCQAVEYKGLIYLAGAFTGGYPTETPVEHIYIYDPVTKQWHTGPEIPAHRRRGSCGVVVYNDKLYLVSGIINGHTSGHVAWFDEYDPSTNTWKELPDAPRPRDHFHAAVIGDKLIVASGRRSSYPNTFGLTVSEVDIYNFTTGQWTTGPNPIPTPRAGASVAVIGQEVIYIGGESMSQLTAHATTEAWNSTTGQWRTLSDLNTGRHASQAICSNNTIYIAGGSGSRGGTPELNSMEKFYFGTPSAPQGNTIAKGNLNIPSTVNFGVSTPGNSSKRIINVTNTNGNQSILISNIHITNSNEFSIDSNFKFPFIVHPGQHLTIRVSFTPSFTGEKSGQLVIQNTGSNTQQTCLLTGGSSTTEPQATIYLINAGGTEVSANGKLWATDSETQPSPYSNHTATFNKIKWETFTGTNNTDAPDAIFNSYRWDGGVAGDPADKELRWSFPVENGTYQVSLYFIETYPDAGIINGRVFDVAIEGVVVFDNLDIFAEAGFNNTLQKNATVNVVDGILNIDLLHVIQNPRIHGIQIKGSNGNVNENKLVITPQQINFPSVEVGKSSVSSFVLSNTGETTITISNIQLSGNDNSFSLTQSTPFTIAPGSSQTLNITFAPTSAGTKSATLVISTTSGDIPISLPVSGEAHFPSTGNTGAIVYRINAGGNEIVNPDKNWDADNISTPSGYSNYNDTYNKLTVINYTGANLTDAPTEVFNTYRWDGGVQGDPISKEMRWTFPVEPETYIVKLYFSETWPEAQTSGARVFDILMENTLVENNFDIYAEAGFNHAITKSYEIEVTDGVLNIDFIHKVQNPRINAIEILRKQTGSVIIHPESLSFEATPAGTISTSKQISIINNTSSTVTISSVQSANNDFEINNSYISTIPPGDTSKILIYFSPDSPGTKTGAITIHHSSTGSPLSVLVSGNATQPTSVTPKPIYRVNTGGYPIQDTALTWEEDTHALPSGYSNYEVTGNKTYATSEPITVAGNVPATTPSIIFSSERSNGVWIEDSLTYTFPVAPGGEVEVRLYFAEIYFNDPGSRKFDIKIEDSLVTKDYDILEEVSKNTGVMKSYITTSDGNININLIRKVNQPKISGIEIICLNDKCLHPAARKRITELAGVYPNPVREKAVINFKEAINEMMKVEVYNAAGELMEVIPISPSSSSSIDFNMANYPTGMYFLQITDKEKIYERIKILKD
ncbi:MAG TPA: malectin domain-containing carbohydrate-binding protein [Cytophagaceae bacterium]